MSNTKVAAAKRADQIPCLLLPLRGRRLLVPTVTVAEVVPMAPFQEEPDTPDWFLGHFQWRGQEVPLVSFEILSGETESSLVSQGRVAVLNNTGVSDKLPFIAIATMGIPRLARVAPEDIVENTGALSRPCELMQVKVGMEEFAIPDVAALERAYLSLGHDD